MEEVLIKEWVVDPFSSSADPEGNRGTSDGVGSPSLTPGEVFQKESRDIRFLWEHFSDWSYRRLLAVERQYMCAVMSTNSGFRKLEGVLKLGCHHK